LTTRVEMARPAVRAYAARGGQTEDEYVRSLGEPPSPETAAAALLGNSRADAAGLAPGYLLTVAGLQRLP